MRLCRPSWPEPRQHRTTHERSRDSRLGWCEVSLRERAARGGRGVQARRVTDEGGRDPDGEAAMITGCSVSACRKRRGRGRRSARRASHRGVFWAFQSPLRSISDRPVHRLYHRRAGCSAGGGRGGGVGGVRRCTAGGWDQSPLPLLATDS